MLAIKNLRIILLMEEILHQLMIGSLSHDLQGFINPRWCRISSINSMARMKHQKRPFTTRKLGSHDWQPCSGTLLADRFAHAIAFRAWCGCEFYSRWFYWINMKKLQAKKVWIKPKRLELNKQTNVSGGNGCFETLAVIHGEDIKMIGSTLFVVNLKYSVTAKRK